MVGSENAPDTAVEGLAQVLRGCRVVALTGAGVSTESGIPDYRSPEASARARRPIHGPEFVRSAAVRRRYWARAMAGWEAIRHAQPGAAHLALARLEERGVIAQVVTQNVDRLHHAAGSRAVIELHGALAEVACLECGALEDRDAVQVRMRDANRSWSEGRTAMVGGGPGGATATRDGHVAAAPFGRLADGDAELSDEAVEGFDAPACLRCGGPLKPRVVFFGENVARAIVDEAFAAVDAAGALLVAGTSLAVFSGYRFLRRAVERRIPVAIVNRGPVRGEEHASIKVEAGTGATLAALAGMLVG
jgi:NAD-dependent SIR2 family protein deacetylase